MKDRENNIEQVEIKAIVQPLLTWYEANARVLPWRENQDPYRVWISEIMLQQTRVEAVIPYFHRFMKRLPTIEALATIEEEELHKLWEGLGYYSRVRNLQKAAQVICSEYQGDFPTEYEQVLELPGIGAYTAGAICSIAFEQPRAAVDGNVLRVITRILEDGTDIGSTAFRKYVGQLLEQVYPLGKCGAFSQSLIELGAIVCVPNGEPKCTECPIRSICKAGRKQTWDHYPVKKPKAKRKIEERTVFILEYKNQIAVHRRADKGLLAGLWEFPNIEGVLEVQEAMNYLSNEGIVVDTTQSIVSEPMKKHIFTHIEWHMHVYHIHCKNVNSEVPYSWFTKENLNTMVALPTAFRKLWSR